MVLVPSFLLLYQGLGCKYAFFGKSIDRLFGDITIGGVMLPIDVRIAQLIGLPL